MQIHVWGIRGLPEVLPGDDLAELVAAAAPDLRDGDVLVVTSKVVSKAEGRLLEVRPEPAERERARQDAVEAETVRVVAERGATRIVVTRHGLVLAAAGVDASNLPPDRIALLPEDPDASARAIREGLRERLGVTVAVLVSDTFGRPWRQGVADVAVGAAGFPVLHDLRGRSDGYGNPLQMTQVAVADEVAAAADLVKGKLSGTPVAVVRGLVFEPPSPDPGAAASIRPAEEDLFPLGTVQARRTLLARPPWAQPTAVRPAPGGPEAAGRAVAAVRAAVAGAPPLRVLTGGEAADVLAPLVPPAGWSGTDTATAGCVVVLEAADDQDGAVTAVAAHHLALALRAEGCAGVLVQAPGAPGRHTVVAVVAADGTDDADRPTAPGPPT